MTTRLYFPRVSTTAPVTPSSWSAGWNKTTGTATDRQLILRKQAINGLITGLDDSYGNVTNTASGTSGHFTAICRRISPKLLAQTISGTVKGQFLGLETASGDNFTLAVAIKVIKSDGTDRGVLLAVSASDDTSAAPPEFATAAATNRKILDSAESAAPSLSSLAVSAGDRIVVEVGYRQASTSTNAGGVGLNARVEDLGDLPENDTETSINYAPWIEFSGDILFEPTFAGSAATPEDSATATGTADPTAITPPTGMVAGDLVCMLGHQRATGATLAVSAAGGQTWTTETAAGTTNCTLRLFWCKFNGTWSTNPSVDFSATTCNTAVMHVFRPPRSTDTWSVNQAIATSSDATDPFTITGQTTSGSAPTVTFAGWASADDNTYGTLTAGWDVTGTAQYRNTSGSDQSCSFAHKVQTTAGATGNVEKSQLTLGADTAATMIISFAAAAAALSATVNQISETDTAQAITVNPKRRLANQTTETDLAQAITRVKLRAIGQTTETDSAQAMTVRKSRTLGQNTETDTANAVTWAPKRRLIGQNAETDTAQAMNRVKLKAIGQTTETDTAQAVAWAPKKRLVAQTSETDTAQALTRLKSRTLGQTGETDTAQAVARLKRTAIAQATETDTAQAVAPNPQRRLVSQASETDAAQTFTHRKTVTLGQGTETDAAQTVTRAIATITVAVGQATEADSAQAVSSRKTAALGQASETDAAQSLTSRKVKSIGQAGETDTAQVVSRLKTRAIAQATETDLAQALTSRKTKLLAQATEIDLARAVAHVKMKAIGQATETDLAQIIAHSKIAAIAQALETNIALSLAWAPKRRLVNAAIESDTAQIISVVEAFTLGQVIETDLAESIAVVLGISPYRFRGQIVDAELRIRIANAMPRIRVADATQRSRIVKAQRRR